MFNKFNFENYYLDTINLKKNIINKIFYRLHYFIIKIVIIRSNLYFKLDHYVYADDFQYTR